MLIGGFFFSLSLQYRLSVIVFSIALQERNSSSAFKGGHPTGKKKSSSAKEVGLHNLLYSVVPPPPQPKRRRLVTSAAPTELIS